MTIETYTRDWTIRTGKSQFGLKELHTTPTVGDPFVQTIVCAGSSSIAVLASAPAVAAVAGSMSLVVAILLALMIRFVCQLSAVLSRTQRH